MNVKDVSEKISTLNPMTTVRNLNLPSIDYGPFCLKIIQEFIVHHNLPINLPVPIAGVSTHVALSRIFDIMLYSMGEEKREAVLRNLDEYNMSVPACFRQ